MGRLFKFLIVYEKKGVLKREWSEALAMIWPTLAMISLTTSNLFMKVWLSIDTFIDGDFLQSEHFLSDFQVHYKVNQYCVSCPLVATFCFSLRKDHKLPSINWRRSKSAQTMRGFASKTDPPPIISKDVIWVLRAYLR